MKLRGISGKYMANTLFSAFGIPIYENPEISLTSEALGNQVMFKNPEGGGVRLERTDPLVKQFASQYYTGTDAVPQTPVPAQTQQVAKKSLLSQDEKDWYKVPEGYDYFVSPNVVAGGGARNIKSAPEGAIFSIPGISQSNAYKDSGFGDNYYLRGGQLVPYFGDASNAQKVYFGSIANIYDPTGPTTTRAEQVATDPNQMLSWLKPVISFAPLEYAIGPKQTPEQSAAAYNAALNDTTTPRVGATPVTQIQPSPSTPSQTQPPIGATLISGPSGLQGLTESQIWREPNSKNIYKLAVPTQTTQNIPQTGQTPPTTQISTPQATSGGQPTEQIPAGYEKISGVNYPTKEAQQAAYTDIRPVGTVGTPGSYLIGKSIQKIGQQPPTTPSTITQPAIPTNQQTPQQQLDIQKATGGS